MMSRLFNFIATARDVYHEIRVQRQFNRTFLAPYLDELEKRHHGAFYPEQRQKIEQYYGLFITAFLCSSYTRLYGRVLTPDERKRATLFGILTPVGDDLFDIDRLSHEAIRQITFEPGSFPATTFSAKVACEVQQYMLDHVPHPEAYLKASKAVLDIQVDTAQQTDPSISREALERITWTKGAVSVIIYHQCLDTCATPDMQHALFLTGSLYQLGNDLFDLYKDVRDNIFTLVNTCTDYAALRQQFADRVREQNRAIVALPYPKQAKERFCVVMNTINARSMVALDQLVRFQQQQGGGKIDWWQQPRSAMIVDMEKPTNLLKWLYYAWQLPYWV